MSPIEYSLIFLSIVIGYVVTIGMVGWGKLIKYYDPGKFSLEYLLWSLILFFYLLFMWFWTFSYHLPYLDSYFWFTLLMIRPLLIYFCFEVLLPDTFEGHNYREHFWKVSRKFFALVSLLWVYEIGLIYLQGNSVSFNNPRSTIYLIGLPVTVSLMIVRDHRYGRWVTVFLFLLMFASLGHDMLNQHLHGGK